MRFFETLALALLTTGALAAPFRHPHHLLNKRDVSVVTSKVYAYTTVTLEAAASAISTNGAAKEAATAAGDAETTSSVAASVTPAASSSVAASVTPVASSSVAASVTPVSSSAVVDSATSAAASSSVIPTSSSVVASSSEVASSTTSSAAASATSTGSSSGGFQDGVYDCTDFPSDQSGVVALDYLGYGGYSGIQIGDGAGSSCVEGAYCSYACSPGMLKTQWPSTQPSDGETRGGLLCKGGKLYRTNTAYDNLCENGVGTASVQNTLGQGVAICQTDYPGSENMVIPTYVGGGATSPLSVTDNANYFQWEGKGTSAQYYVNKAGYTAEQGCQWGTSSGDYGNWSPLVFGAGMTDGTTWLSISQNPLTSQLANYNVKIVGADGASVSGTCVFENGAFQNGGSGCTVGITSGSGVFVFY
ncbi:putative secreted beta-glucosidase PSU1 [Schizosaccharomyces pombe]|uniref:Probable secreted beta-glucosidase PSU1 n=1 Tax=Schizosaccharomyces pombe (strain 972 / ATCC 24843) TaxID=284812 RepID=PSU1_SCHPO|nr:putative beta-glucosidase Psu1 [Schizosaccharomyces pombe]Q9UR09.1 RecName: Full=Probable secreted beta-glucosidase PSU1; AltName: Full=Cell wall synthesis protein psu1; Flags: Precursor [Schizosaccharomyces pombe 972h-]BAA83907.1 PSU1 [Schizosaccharomyces pombe]CAB65613.1 cell wall protein Psu1, beta-glucosidase (predicted) [Schizosaccharomyces pombe]|eukprot:NP_593500.1 putative beta-glucosidase Psu1 [Schizosaccharomyces pombe]